MKATFLCGDEPSLKDASLIASSFRILDARIVDSPAELHGMTVENRDKKLSLIDDSDVIVEYGSCANIAAVHYQILKESSLESVPVVAVKAIDNYSVFARPEGPYAARVCQNWRDGELIWKDYSPLLVPPGYCVEDALPAISKIEFSRLRGLSPGKNVVFCAMTLGTEVEWHPSFEVVMHQPGGSNIGEILNCCDVVTADDWETMVKACFAGKPVIAPETSEAARDLEDTLELKEKFVRVSDFSELSDTCMSVIGSVRHHATVIDAQHKAMVRLNSRAYSMWWESFLIKKITEAATSKLSPPILRMFEGRWVPSVQ